MSELVEFCKSGLEGGELQWKKVLISDKNPEQKQHNFQDRLHDAVISTIEDLANQESVQKHQLETRLQPDCNIL